MQDRIIKSFPEVATVFGKAGRAATATDPAPTEMFETIITLKSKAEWRAGVTIESLKAEMDRALQFPGCRTPGPCRSRRASTCWQRAYARQSGSRCLARISGAGQAFARDRDRREDGAGDDERLRGTVIGGYYLDIVPDQTALGRYGLTVGDVQETIAMALGGETITTTVEGRERYSVNIRYPRELRSSPQTIAAEVQVPMPDGGFVPLGEVAAIKLDRGATTIRTENGQLAVYIFIDMAGRDLGGYVTEARRAVEQSVRFPPGTYVQWSGQFEYLERAEARLKIVGPLTLLAIFTLLYLNFRKLPETLIVMLSVPFSLIGGIWMMWWLQFNMSVAAAVGFIALAGVAAETGVIMLVYLENAMKEIAAERSAVEAAS